MVPRVVLQRVAVVEEAPQHRLVVRHALPHDEERRCDALLGEDVEDRFAVRAEAVVEGHRHLPVADRVHTPLLDHHRPRAADLGYVSATTAMGSMYLQGSGVNRNPAQAKNYFLKGAQKGDAQSMMYLSMMHAKGDGVEQSNQEAYRWLLSMPDSAMNTNIKQNQEQFAGMLSAEEQQLAKHRAQAFKIQYGIK